MTRILAFLILLLSIKFIPLILFAILVFLYSYHWKFSFELVFLAILADAFYGPVGVVPYYILVVGGIVIFFEWLKPQLLFYN